MTVSEQTLHLAPEQIEADLDSIPYRQPIIDYPATVYDESLSPADQNRAHEELKQARARQDARNDNHWLMFTEAARRALLASSDARAAALPLTTEPLRETLPREAMDELAEHDARTARLARLMGDTLGSVLALDPVPDALLTPDLRHAERLRTKAFDAVSLSWIRPSSREEYEAYLRRMHDTAVAAPGISQAEKKLVARRYRYAREVKLLGLMAELLEQPFDGTEAKNGDIIHELKSGIKLVMTSEAFEANPKLLDPRSWESRRQLKDRVYTVVIDGEDYILKERKTPRHTDVKQRGHVDGLTSKQEFETAKEFAELGAIRQRDIQLRWEKPLGYAEFPDGYQFCLFQHEPDLETDRQRQKILLAAAIIASPDGYAEEFAHIQQRAKEIYHERTDIIPRDEWTKPAVRFAFSKKARHTKKVFESLPETDEITFEEFAYSKAFYLIEDAEELLVQVMHARGYTNSDIDGYGFRIQKGSRPVLEIIGFDFEYYSKNPTRVSQIMEEERQYREQSSDGRPYQHNRSRVITRAASYAVLEQMGIALPSVEEY